MKNITSYFTSKAVEAIRDQIGIELDDSHDYSQNELAEIYERITDEFPYRYKTNGDPDSMGEIFEQILDSFPLD